METGLLKEFPNCHSAFLNFLRGMETQVQGRLGGALSDFLNFLRGMETCVC